MPCRNSSAAVQQAQPFCSSTVSSGDDVPPVFLDTSAASMFISATSFTMRPTLIPALFSSRCFSSVVLPAPRKPESSVIGVVSGKSAFSPEPAIFVCPGPTAAAHGSAGGTEGSSREGPRLPPRAIQKLPPPGHPKVKGVRQRCMCLLAYCYAIHVTPSQTQQRAPAIRCAMVRPIRSVPERRGVPNVPAAADSTHAPKPATQRPPSSRHNPASAREGSRERSTAGPYDAPFAGQPHRAWLASRTRATTTRMTNAPKPTNRHLP